MRRIVEYDLGVHREPSMRFIQFTSVHTGHPIHIRDDLIAGWTVEHGKTLLLLQGYDIDIEVKEPPEQVLHIMKGEDTKSSLTIKDACGTICGDRGKQKWDYQKKQGRLESCRTDRSNQKDCIPGGLSCADGVTIRTSSSTSITEEEGSGSAKSGEGRIFRSKSGRSRADGGKT